MFEIMREKFVKYVGPGKLAYAPGSVYVNYEVSYRFIRSGSLTFFILREYKKNYLSSVSVLVTLL